MWNNIDLLERGVGLGVSLGCVSAHICVLEQCAWCVIIERYLEPSLDGYDRGIVTWGSGSGGLLPVVRHSGEIDGVGL